MIDSQALMLEATQLNSSNKNLELWLLGVKCLGANLSSLRSPTLFQYIWCEKKGGRVAKQKKKGEKKVGGVIFFSSLFILWSNLHHCQNQ